MTPEKEEGITTDLIFYKYCFFFIQMNFVYGIKTDAPPPPYFLRSPSLSL